MTPPDKVVGRAFDGPKQRYLRSPLQFLRLVVSLVRTWIVALFVPARARVSKQFAERLNLTVSGVNRCAYCSHLHTKLALESGLSDQEIQGLLGGEQEGVPERQAAALAYATHWAETEGRASSESRARIVSRYGLPQARHIEAVIHSVYLGNICSLTVEQFKQGFRPPGRIRFFFAFLLAWPVAWAVIRMGGYNQQRASVV